VVSIKVDVEALSDTLAKFGSVALLITVSAAGRPHVVSVQATIDGGLLRMGLGRRTAENIRDNPAVTLVWPDGSDDDYCLIVDAHARPLGTAEVLVVEPESAVLHRLANGTSGLPKCVAVEPGMRGPTRG
jgi:hypothetical protein